MGDWKGTAKSVLGYAVFAALGLLLLTTVVQGWSQKLDSRYFVSAAFLLIAGLSVLLWKRLALWNRVYLLVASFVVLIGALALYYGPDAKTSFLIGPLNLAFLVNLLIFLSFTLALAFLLLGMKLPRGVKIGVGVFGALCSIPFLIGLIKNIPVGDLLRGAGFFTWIPWFLQPSFLGLMVLLPILLIFLGREIFRATRSESRSTFRNALNGVMALVPFLIGLAGIGAVGQPGVVARYYADHSYGSFKKQDIEKVPELSWKSPPVATQAGDRFWVEWEGMLQAPKEGEYEFRIEGDGQGFLFLDGKRVFGDGERSGKVMLKAGPHALRAGAIEDKKEGKFLVQWKPKEDKAFHAIDPKYLAYEDAQARWRRTPRQAAQVGIEWLQSASSDWQEDHRCFGCHVQGQVLMGLSVARQNQYRVNPDAFQALFEFTQKKQNEDGSYHSGNHVTATGFAGMGMAYAQEAQGSKKNNALLASSDWLVAHQKESGEFEIDHGEPPIDQGSVLTTANAVFALMEADRETGNDKYKKAAEKGLNWIAAAPLTTTQDKIFKILALSRYGSAPQQNLIGPLVEELKREQAPDGGWKETKEMAGSNAYATGQVLYAFKKSGVSINSPEFTRGVRFLLENQKVTGEWPAANTQTHRPSEFAPTMWAVIGLAGSFGEIMPEILEPKDRGSVQGAVTLKAQVTNFTDSEIESVDFETDGKPLGRAQKSAPENLFTLPWNTDGLPPGEHKIRVIAANGAGQKGESTITVFTGTGLKVKFLNPAANAVVTGDSTLQAQAEALYGQTVSRVEFFANGQKLGEQPGILEGNLYQVPWASAALPEGEYKLQVVATNSTGQTAQDQVTVKKIAPLSVKITGPVSGQEVSGVAICTAQVVNNTEIPVSHVEFFLGSDIPLGRSGSDRFEVPCSFAGVTPGAYQLKAVATNAQGLTATDAIPISVGEAKGPGYLKVALKNLDEPGGEQVLYFPPDVIELVFDISGSMWEQIEGKAKIEIAREVMANLVRAFPKDVNFALRVYGHRSKSDCQDSELLVPFGKLDPDQVIQKVNALKPKGMTLIDYSMREALKDLQPQQGSKILIVVTDGIETCKGDPVKAAQAMIDAGLKTKIHVVGFDLAKSPEAVEQLKKVAEVGQGKYYTAANSQEMNQALAEAVKITYSLFDEGGNLIFTKPLGTESNEVMSGTYKVVVATDPLLVLPAVKIEKGKTATVEVIKQNKAFRIESPQAVAPGSPPPPIAAPQPPVASPAPPTPPQ